MKRKGVNRMESNRPRPVSGKRVANRKTSVQDVMKRLRLTRDDAAAKGCKCSTDPGENQAPGQCFSEPWPTVPDKPPSSGPGLHVCLHISKVEHHQCLKSCLMTDHSEF